MFYRMSRLHFDDDRFDELIAWAQSVKPRVQGIDGLVLADIARTGSGEGMIVAGYETESDFEAARETVSGLFEEMAGFLTVGPIPTPAHPTSRSRTSRYPSRNLPTNSEIRSIISSPSRSSVSL